MCAGGNQGSLPIDQRTDAELQAMVKQAKKHPGKITIWKKGQSSSMNYNPYAANAVKAQEVLDQRAKTRSQLEALANERKATVAAQQVQQAQMQQQLKQQQADQLAQAEATRTRYQDARTQAAANQSSQINQLKIEQGQKMATLRATGDALRGSALALNNQGSTQGPTAQVDPRKQRGASPRSTSASLRMGSTGSSTGSGANVSV